MEVGYDRENVDKGGYRGLTQTDRYGRTIPKAAHGTIRFDAPTNLEQHPHQRKSKSC